MAMKISQAELRRASGRLDALRNRMKNMRKQGEKVTEQVILTAETSTAAFAMGFTQGKFKGGIEILGMPLELLLGGGLNLAGWLGLGGKLSPHLHGIGNGCLAAFMTTVGRGVGAAGIGSIFPAQQQAVSGHGEAQNLLSDQELAALVAAAA